MLISNDTESDDIFGLGFGRNIVREKTEMGCVGWGSTGGTRLGEFECLEELSLERSMNLCIEDRLETSRLSM